MIRITSNANEVAADFEAMARALPRLAAEEVQETATDALPVVRKATPVDRGDLRGAWRMEKTRTGAKLVNDKRYAGFVEGGTLPDVAADAFIEAADKRSPFKNKLIEVA